MLRNYYNGKSIVKDHNCSTIIADFFTYSFVHFYCRFLTPKKLRILKKKLSFFEEIYRLLNLPLKNLRISSLSELQGTANFIFN